MPRLGPLARASALIISTFGMFVLIAGLWLLCGGARLLLDGGTWARLCLGFLLGVIFVVLGMACLFIQQDG
jgi:hypothetical protein